MREIFWREGARFPEPVVRAMMAGSGILFLAAVWAVIAGRTEFATVLAAEAVLIPIMYGYGIGFNEKRIRESYKARKFDAVAVGYSFEHGPLLIVYGVAAWAALFLFSLLPSWFLGVPSYAFAVASAFAVVIVAPIGEESFVGGATWSFFYNFRVPREVKWLFATLAASFFFVIFHTGTYAGAGDFAWVQLFVMRFVFSLANWLPTLVGHQPSLLPGLTGHMLLNGLWYVSTCIQGTGAQSALATQLC